MRLVAGLAIGASVSASPAERQLPWVRSCLVAALPPSRQELEPRVCN